MESAGLSSLNLITGADLRNAMENLLSVKHILAFRDENITVPPGYYKDKKAEEKINHTYNVYTSQNPVYMAYSYKDVIKESDYLELSALDKQEILLQYAVAPDHSVSDFDLGTVCYISFIKMSHDIRDTGSGLVRRKCLSQRRI